MGKFTVPTKEEGFDEVNYEWHRQTQCADYVKDWILRRKLTTRIEDLQPSEWFNQQWKTWQEQLAKWRQVQIDWKDPAKQAARQAAEAPPKKEDAPVEAPGEAEKKDEAEGTE